MTPELIALVKQEEGLRLAPYLCPAGYPTIGYGHRVASMDITPITEHQADVMLESDLARSEKAAQILAPNLANEPRRLAALTDLCFNVGAEVLVHSGVLRCLKSGDWAGAAERFRKWNHARVNGQLVELPGLSRRRAIAAQWIEAG